MVPMMGRIAAGTPISAIQTRLQTLAMPPEFLGSGEHFALEVRGDSMIDAGIFENDTVIIRKQDTAETGDIVVALIDEEEATLKRLRKRGASIALEAANPAYETRIFGPDRVRVQGKNGEPDAPILSGDCSRQREAGRTRGVEALQRAFWPASPAAPGVAADRGRWALPPTLELTDNRRIRSVAGYTRIIGAFNSTVSYLPK